MEEVRLEDGRLSLRCEVYLVVKRVITPVLGLGRDYPSNFFFQVYYILFSKHRVCYSTAKSPPSHSKAPPRFTQAYSGLHNYTSDILLLLGVWVKGKSYLPSSC